VGADYRIMLDSTWGYDFPTALRVGRAIEELGFYWYEDPLAEACCWSRQWSRQARAKSEARR